MEKLLILTKDNNCIDTVVHLLKSSHFTDEFMVFKDEWEFLEYIIERKDNYGILVDIDLPSCDNLRLIKILVSLHGSLALTLLSSNGRYAIEAFGYDVTGYLMKPINGNKLIESIEKMKSQINQNKKSEVYFQTFGTFEIFVKDRPLNWRNSKSKELLAFLVDARGDSVSSEIIQQSLWPDKEDASATFHTTLFHLRKLLEKNKIEFVLECSRGSQRVNADRFKCDFYTFEKEVENGTQHAYRNAFDLYKGNYLEKNGYPWSTFNKVRLEMLFEKVCQAMGMME